MKQFNEKQLAEIQHCLDRLYSLLGMDVHAAPMSYRSMSKQELADAAHVDRRRLYDWMSAPTVKATLEEMGITKNTKLLHPRAVAYICETFGITV